MSDTVKPKKRWFLRVELAVLICVVCIWVIKSVTIDIDSTKAAVLKQVVKIKPNSADAHKSLGDAYFNLEKYEQAIEAYKEAVRNDPDDADAHKSIGISYSEAGRHEEAIEARKEAIRIDPDDAYAHIALGLVTVKLVVMKRQ